MRKIIWWLIAGTRGGKNRLRIIDTLKEEPMNANQLAEELNLDYKTIQHHLKLLKENNIITTVGEGYGQNYFLSDKMKDNMNVLDEIRGNQNEK
ncbi:MAG: ArsR/SmtB family transcription factor [Candidatus Aenigmatarchaeota archaeon]